MTSPRSARAASSHTHSLVRHPREEGRLNSDFCGHCASSCAITALRHARPWRDRAPPESGCWGFAAQGVAIPHYRAAVLVIFCQTALRTHLLPADNAPRRRHGCCGGFACLWWRRRIRLPAGGPQLPQPGHAHMGPPARTGRPTHATRLPRATCTERGTGVFVLYADQRTAHGASTTPCVCG